MSKTVIEVHNISKRYRIGLKEKRHETFAGQVLATLKSPLENLQRIRRMSRFGVEEDESVFWALKDINFEVKEGEVLGIIGHNGAGKSTLLKILSRVAEPTTGEVRIKGRISALLEVGTGFHPELTGRENVYMNGTILGMTKREIDAKFDEIVDFSGVEKYIDTPVKFYSSGMKVRLAFAVAAHLEPEILIIDEVLAVGDAEFQRKCLGKMHDVSTNDGRTVLFVSHNMVAVEALCHKALWLNHGRYIELGDTSAIIRKYLQQTRSNHSSLRERKDREGFGDIKLIEVKLNAPNGIKPGEGLIVIADYENISLENQNIKITEFGLSIWNEKDIRIISISTELKQELLGKPIPSSGSIQCIIKKLPLIPGIYRLNFFISSKKGIEDYVTDILEFEVQNSNYYKTGKMVDPAWGLIVLDHEWSLPIE